MKSNELNQNEEKMKNLADSNANTNSIIFIKYLYIFVHVYGLYR